jgi:hypothetical protein
VQGQKIRTTPLETRLPQGQALWIGAANEVVEQGVVEDRPPLAQVVRPAVPCPSLVRAWCAIVATRTSLLQESKGFRGSSIAKVELSGNSIRGWRVLDWLEIRLNVTLAQGTPGGVLDG